MAFTQDVEILTEGNAIKVMFIVSEVSSYSIDYSTQLFYLLLVVVPAWRISLILNCSSASIIMWVPDS